LDAWVGAALDLVPKGDACQSEFRMTLNVMFRNALGPKPEDATRSVGETVQVAIERVGCRPTFDPALLVLDWPMASNG
jgi:hypothetical protein